MRGPRTNRYSGKKVAHTRKVSIPSTYVRVDFTQYPAAIAELQYAMDFLKVRSHGNDDNFSTWDLDSTEFYFVPELSGQDLLPVEADLKEVQVSYTRDIVDPSSDTPIRPIVEILKPLFDQLSPQYQAFILLHELMHHKPYGQHTVISPIIKDLNFLLPLKQRQDQGDRSKVSDDELSASKDLEKIMSKFEDGLQMDATPYGGGLIAGFELTAPGSFAMDSSNFIGVSSKYTSDNTSSGPTGLEIVDSEVHTTNCAPFSDNRFKNSQVNVNCEYGNYGPGSASKNIFINTTLTANVATRTKFDENTFSDVNFHSIANFEAGDTLGPNSAINKNTFQSIDISFGDLDINGSNNSIKRFSQTTNGYGNGQLHVEGNDNNVEDLNFTGNSDMLFLENSTTVQRLTMVLDFRTLMIKNNSTVRDSKFEDEANQLRRCETDIGPNQIVTNQDILCQKFGY